MITSNKIGKNAPILDGRLPWIFKIAEKRSQIR